MINKTILPILGGSGWSDDPDTQIAELFAHALVADYSQSTEFTGQVTSIPYIIAKNQKTPNRMSGELEAALNIYYSRYFTTTDITVGYIDTKDGNYNLRIYIKVTLNGVSYSTKRAGVVGDGILSRVVEVANQ